MKALTLEVENIAVSTLMKKLKSLILAFLGKGPETEVEFEFDFIHIIIFLFLVCFAWATFSN